MAMKIDPKARAEERKELGLDNPRADWLHVAGKFVLSPVGYELFIQPNDKETPGLLVRFVVVEGDEAGKVVERVFWRTPAASGALGDLSNAMKYESPWDCDEESDVKRVLSHGDRVLLGTVKGEDYENRDGETKTKFEVSFFDAIRKPFVWADDAKEIRKEARANFDEYMQWRSEHPRKAKSDGGGGGGRGGNSGGGGRSGGGRSGGARGTSGASDDIPF